MLKLRLVQAEHGDCLIVEYGSPANPRYMLIDGGPAYIYEQHLRGELLKIRDAGGKLDLAILSHVDDDHVNGMLDLMAELREQQDAGMPETIAIDALWHNTFSQTLGNEVETRFRALMEDAGATRDLMIFSDMADRSIRQGDQLTQLATALDIRINPQLASNQLLCLDEVPEPMVLDNLSLQVVGPTWENLEGLRKEWTAWLEKHRPDILVRDPIIAERAARVADRSIPNLSSIMLLAEADGKTMLLTGDGRGDHLVENLKRIDALDSGGRLHVDVLKVPHHGSARNVTKAVFETITADTYVICANGKYANPDLETLQWIVEAAKEQGRAIGIVVTNVTDSSRQLVEEYDPDEYGYRMTEMKPDDHSMTLELSA